MGNYRSFIWDIPDLAWNNGWGPANLTDLARTLHEESQTMLIMYCNDSGLEQNIRSKKTYSLYKYIIREIVWLSSPDFAPRGCGGSSTKGQPIATHRLCCKGVAVNFYGFTLCAAALHHYELVQHPC